MVTPQPAATAAFKRQSKAHEGNWATSDGIVWEETPLTLNNNMRREIVDDATRALENNNCMIVACVRAGMYVFIGEKQWLGFLN